jgi:dCMP deaminase
MNRPTFDQLFMGWAQQLSQRSTCSRLQVGCLIVSPDSRKVIALGYNGGASGQENACASLEPGQCGHLHAEANAIINTDVPRHQAKVVFVTDLPCAMCAKMLVNLGGVARVVYGRDYRIRDAVEILKQASIPCVQFP